MAPALAAEASPQLRDGLHTIAATFEALASAVASVGHSSLAQIDEQWQSLTTNDATGRAFCRLLASMVTMFPAETRNSGQR